EPGDRQGLGHAPRREGLPREADQREGAAGEDRRARLTGSRRFFGTARVSFGGTTEPLSSTSATLRREPVRRSTTSTFPMPRCCCPHCIKAISAGTSSIALAVSRYSSR